jgi:hypothetical protein
MTMKDHVLRAACAMAALSTVAVARSAHAETFILEAENAATLTNPLIIKDAFTGNATPASLGRYIEVEAGQNNKTGSQPAVDPVTGQVPGQVCFPLFFTESGDYRVYGRVIAPTDGDDSFWVRVARTGTESWINWNTISLGSSWHWDSIHLNNSTTPIVFHFAENDAANLCIAAREDGTKLDSLLVTSDPAVNPITATQPIVVDTHFNGQPVPELNALQGKNSIFLQWTAVPGATSYKVKNKIPDFSQGEACFNADPATFTTISNNPSGFTFTDTNAARGAGSCYLVTATGGGSTIASFVVDAGRMTSFFQVHETSVFSLTPPFESIGSILRTNPDTGVLERTEPEGIGSQANLPKQLDANAITHSNARWDFQLAESITLRIWGLVTFFNPGTDSFWVRMDRGPWFKWNGWQEDPTSGCSKDVVRDDNGDFLRNGGGWVPFWDGDNPSAPKKTFNLGTGTHTLELAFREPAAGMDRIGLKSELDHSPGGCFD